MAHAIGVVREIVNDVNEGPLAKVEQLTPNKEPTGAFWYGRIIINAGGMVTIISDEALGEIEKAATGFDVPTGATIGRKAPDERGGPGGTGADPVTAPKEEADGNTEPGEPGTLGGADVDAPADQGGDAEPPPETEKPRRGRGRQTAARS